MLTIEAGVHDGTAVLTASGRLTAGDYARFVPAFERLAEARGPLRVLLDLREFRGWEVSALWEDLKFTAAHQGAFQRIAVIGDKRWKAWGTWLSKPFFRAEMRYFDRAKTDQAWSWLTL